MHKREKILELINRSIDGTISMKEERTLRNEMERDADLRKYHDDLMRVSVALRGMRHIEPPPFLRQHILNAVHLPEKKHPVAKGSILESFGIASLIIRHRIAFAFSGGLVLGMVVIAAVIGLVAHDDVLNISRIYGTLVDRALLDRAPATGGAEFSTQGVSGRVKLGREGDVLFADLSTVGENTSEIQFSFNPEVIELTGFRHFDGPVPLMKTTGQTVNLTIDGKNRSALAFSIRSNATIQLRFVVFQAHRQVYEQTLIADK